MTEQTQEAPIQPQEKLSQLSVGQRSLGYDKRLRFIIAGQPVVSVGGNALAQAEQLLAMYDLNSFSVVATTLRLQANPIDPSNWQALQHAVQNLAQTLAMSMSILPFPDGFQEALQALNPHRPEPEPQEGEAVMDAANEPVDGPSAGS